MKRINVRLVAAVAVVGFVTTACGGSGSDGAAASSTVTISQVHGVTEFPVGATRIVATGYSIDNLLAIGVKPVAVVETGLPLPAPWQGKQLDGIPIIKSPDKKSIPVEEVAKYRPDLFAGDNYVVDQPTFARVSSVTKVLGGIEENGSSAAWDVQLKALGRILGKQDEVARVLADDKARFAKVREQHPGLAGKSAVLAQYLAVSSTFNFVSSSTDPTNTMFAELGMTLPKAIKDDPMFASGAGAQGGRTPVSLELLPRIAANLMVIYPAGATAADLERLPGYAGLPQVRAGATKVVDLSTVIALNQPTPLSREWILPQLEPLFVNAAQQQGVA
ncbi:ABC transporter substrate-binding protein [Tsukamurella spumae]|uniref:ABC transporter substrate-binding protein n=1 Tax=Tsukamurella spumae TaxID=44753 RepID=A0A846WZY2_9ACTN|nr:ABC transporter substrate-binding protein [Tsukamurella spumae]NKY17592.1 ABC transporter substrate-binding protein [Tsukamurella spumae]